jgi:hypothetical protein
MKGERQERKEAGRLASDEKTCPPMNVKFHHALIE